MRTRVRTVRPRSNDKMRSLAHRSLRGAAHYAADKAIIGAKAKTRSAITRAGLGRLANAVGDTSSLRHPRWRGRGDTGWGVIYARGGANSRAAGALSIYSRGGTIVPGAGKRWLAFPNEETAGRFMGRRKLTPSLYRDAGPGRQGRLQFILTSPRTAVLVARDQYVNRRTGRSRARYGQRKRSERAERQTIIFFLIRLTSRAKRFDQEAIMQAEVATIPRHAADYQAGRGGSGSR